MAIRDMKAARERRALEAKRDAIIVRMQRDKVALAAIRAQLKSTRKRRRSSTT